MAVRPQDVAFLVRKRAKSRKGIDKRPRGLELIGHLPQPASTQCPFAVAAHLTKHGTHEQLLRRKCFTRGAWIGRPELLKFPFN